MSILKEINNQEVSRVLHGAGLRSDSDLRTLTREDLNELFPGVEKFQLRRMIFATIDKHNSQKLKKPVNELLKELEGFIPRDALRAALTDNGVLVDYLHVLKDMKKQMNDVQTFLDAHITLLEDIRTPQAEPKSVEKVTHETMKPQNKPAEWRQQEEQRKSQSAYDIRSDLMVENRQKQLQGNQTKIQHGSGFAPKDDSVIVKKNIQTDQRAQGITGQHGSGFAPQDYSVIVKKNIQTDKGAQGFTGQHGSGFATPCDLGMVKKSIQTDKGAQGIPAKNSVMSPLVYSEVIYKPIVCGKTFNADAQMMGSIRAQVQDRVQIIEQNPDSPDHQVNVVFCPVSSRAGTDAEEALTNVTDDKPVILVLMNHTHQPKPVSSVRTYADLKNVVLCVSVFYHESMPGLLKCKENDDAVSQTQNKLQEYMITKTISVVNTEEEKAESDETCYGDNTRGSTTHGGHTAYHTRDSGRSGLGFMDLSSMFPWNYGKPSN